MDFSSFSSSFVAPGGELKQSGPIMVSGKFSDLEVFFVSSFASFMTITIGTPAVKQFTELSAGRVVLEWLNLGSYPRYRAR